MLVPPPSPGYTLAPGVPPLEPALQDALDACLAALTGRVADVIVAAARTVQSHHVIELLTAGGTLLVMERIGSVSGALA